MSKQIKQDPRVKTVPKNKTVPQPQVKKPADSNIVIPKPYLWLIGVALMVYLPSLWFGFTELDDSIFINDFSRYNSDLGNLLTSFHRGLFDAVKDPYYRPLFLDSMILNFQVSGHEIAGYHIVNVLFHLCSVSLLYVLMLKLNIRPLQAFVLAMLFAVHPALSQAVAWIPGRNDTLLAIFIFSFLIQAIIYATKGTVQSLILSVLFLILAYFTKETAIFAAPAAFVLLTLFLNTSWKDKRMLVQYGLWIACFVLWFVVRYNATIAHDTIKPAEVGGVFISHLPIIIQYLGKVWLPFGLSVFATQQDTVYYYGLAAVLLIGVLLYFSKSKNIKVVFGALALFILFIIPVLLVPNSIDNQTYEQRLYLPMVGMLLLVSQFDFFKKAADRSLLMGSGVVIVLFSLLNIVHQRSFADPLSFWTAAAETSPHSAYANMMLAARTNDIPEAAAGFRKAYALDSTQKYLNFYMGELMQKEDSVLASEKYLLKEKNTSGYYKCDFMLARVAMAKKDIRGAEAYLETYLKADSLDVQANYNLYFLYLQAQQNDLAVQQATTCIRRLQQRLKFAPNDKLTNSDLMLMYFQTHQTAKAKEQLLYMQQHSIDVPNEFVPANVVRQIGM